MCSKIYLNRFCSVYRHSQYSVYKKPSLSLYNWWLLAPKKKQKKYYKLYLKLIKRQLKRLKSKNFLFWIQPKEINNKSLLISKLHSKLYPKKLELPCSFNLNLLFNRSDTYINYKIQRFKGYNAYEEKIFDNKSPNLRKTKLDIFLTYKKIQKRVFR